MKLKIRTYFLLLFLLFISCINQAATNDQHIKVVLRTIGHQFLLQMDDSTSRILPINKIGDRYKIEFENEIEFNPSMLTFTTFEVIEESNLMEHFIIEVEKCETSEVVYSFEVSSKRNDSLAPCQARALPKNCYKVFFTIIDLSSDKPLLNNYAFLIIILIVLFLIVGVFFYLNTRKNRHSGNSGVISIGNYSFDRKGMLLTLKKKEIELSSKEADLLFLLYSNENKTLERDLILNKIWGDEGDYVGRTLDVFISKLRKKLEADPTIKIVNIRGVGYRFVIN